MASHDLSVFLEEFGATVNLTLPGIVSEKERLLLKLLMEGMSVTEISQYRNRSAKTISHQKKQLYEKLGIQSDITFWRDIFFQYHPQVISGTGNKNNFYIPDNRCHHIVTPEAISLALENHEFKPWIQPVFCAQTGVLTGCEVLVRWEHPQTGIIPPDQFIPLAESSGHYCHNDPPTDETDCGYSDAGKTFAAGQFPYWHQRLGGLFFGSGI